MPERSALFEGVQIGKETVPGTGVAASKKLLATSFEVGPAVDVDIFRPNGYKYSTITSLNTEWTEGSISGQMSYTDLVYLLSSVISADTPAVVGTTGSEWVFTSTSTAADAPVTFTIEQGSSVRAHKFTHGMISGLTLSFTKDGTEVSGSVIGKALTDAITITPTPTEIALVPVMRTEVRGYLADTAAGLAGASALTRFLNAEWTLEDRYMPLVTLNGTTDWDTYIESEPNGEITFMHAADAAGMALLTTLRTGATKFMRIQALGNMIGAGPAVYTLTIDTAFKITDVSEFSDEDGIVAIEWTGQFVHDSTWAKAFQVSVINALTAL